jgi:hypothetical protein
VTERSEGTFLRKKKETKFGGSETVKADISKFLKLEGILVLQSWFQGIGF